MDPKEEGCHSILNLQAERSTRQVVTTYQSCIQYVEHCRNVQELIKNNVQTIIIFNTIY